MTVDLYSPNSISRLFRNRNFPYNLVAGSLLLIFQSSTRSERRKTQSLVPRHATESQKNEPIYLSSTLNERRLYTRPLKLHIDSLHSVKSFPSVEI